VISKPGRVGSRALPWVVTRKRAIRLVTIMDVPKAVEAADIFVAVFDEVLVQIHQSQNTIKISNFSQLAPDRTRWRVYKTTNEFANAKRKTKR